VLLDVSGRTVTWSESLANESLAWHSSSAVAFLSTLRHFI